ncbi:MAG: leucine-rich repeat domain-containing protein, partial [Herbaspirillum sp.]|nr:leucine-rich repeat domain-containing protein [Herbaspirillum sp.]
NLTKLWLYNNEVSDISAVAGLTNLTELDLSDNEISDISAVAGLTNLIELDLSDNEISDISAVAGLTNLTELDLSDNEISDITALEGLTNLTELDLSDNEISDITALEGLTNLTELDLLGNRINDIKPLADNIGIGSNDTVLLYNNYTEGSNPLSTTSCTVYIPQLQDRGVTVGHNCSSSLIFPDENLEAVIREAINKPAGDILESDLQGITELDAGMKDIENIEGLQYCTELD